MRSKRPTTAAPVPANWPSAGRPPAPGLHVVATPIGDLGDITLKALDVLNGADLVACEDTRVTRRLLDRYGVATRTTSYHDHNAAKVRPRLLAALAEGQVVALVSDAGTPLISDPGYRLVADARAQGTPVHVAPGASSVMAALCVAGLPTDAFHFAGFLPAKPGARGQAIAGLAGVPGTLVLFESVHRIAATLAALATVFGPRDAAVCRELTKLHETVETGTVAELAARFGAAPAPKGEIVLVIGPGAANAGDAPDETGVGDALKAALASMSLRDAVDAVAGAMNLPRRQVYRRALALSGDDDAR